MKEQRRDNWVAYIDSTQVDNTTEEVSESTVEETPQDTEPTP